MSEIETREKIIKGAFKAFSTHGYHKTSIKKIAEAAGISSSALIYHYFKDKKALFNAVIKDLYPVQDLPILNPELAEQALNVPPEVLLTKIGTGILSLLDDPEIKNIMRLYISEAVRMPEVAASLTETQEQMLAFLTRYFQKQIDDGYFRDHNPEVSARAFVGMIVVNILATIVFTHLKEGFSQTDAYMKEVVTIFLNGIRSET